jgi:hypothetical protein
VIPATVHSKAQICGRSIFGIMGLKSADDIGYSSVVSVCDREASKMSRPWLTRGRRPMGGGLMLIYEEISVTVYKS